MAPLTLPLASAAQPAVSDGRAQTAECSGTESFANVLDEQQSGTASSTPGPASANQQYSTKAQPPAGVVQDGQHPLVSGADSAGVPLVQSTLVLPPALAPEFLNLRMTPAQVLTPAYEDTNPTALAGFQPASVGESAVPDDAQVESDDDGAMKMELAASFAGLLFTPQHPQAAPLQIQSGGPDPLHDKAQNEDDAAIAGAMNAPLPNLVPGDAVAMPAAQNVTQSAEVQADDTANEPMDEATFSTTLATGIERMRSSESGVKTQKLESSVPAAVSVREALQQISAAPRTGIQRVAAKNSSIGPEMFAAAADQMSRTRGNTAAPNLRTAQNTELFTAPLRNNFPVESLTVEMDAAITAGDRAVVSAQNPAISFAQQPSDFSVPDATPAQRLVRTTLEAIPRPLTAMNIEIRPEGFGLIQVRVAAPQSRASNWRVEIRTADPAARALLNDNMNELQRGLKTDWISVQPMPGLGGSGSAQAGAEDRNAGGRNGQRQAFYDPQRHPGKRNQQEVFELFSEQK